VDPGSVIDLNADLGERYESWRPGDDEALLEVVTTAHIACGYHSGDPSVMTETVLAAAQRGVSIGAHPSYPDREGFGRRPMKRTPAEVREDVLYQVAALDGIARAAGVQIRSVKPHGALYNRMAVDPDCALAIAEATADLDPNLWFVVPAGSIATEVGRELGLKVAEEGFCDRAYAPDGTLVPRGNAGAVVTDPAAVGNRAVRLAKDHEIEAADGATLSLAPTTLCLHGDTPGAAALARVVRGALEAAGLAVEAFAGR
jgi:UPF0271 protein